MGAEIITTNQTSQYVIDSSDFVALMPDVTLTVAATTDPGFLADHDGSCTLTILGQVVTYGTAARIGKTSTGTMLARVTVGEDGLLQSLTGYGIDIRRSGSRIDNDGRDLGRQRGRALCRRRGQGRDCQQRHDLLPPGLRGPGDGRRGRQRAEPVRDRQHRPHRSRHRRGVGRPRKPRSSPTTATSSPSAPASPSPTIRALDNTLTLVNTGLVQGDTTAIAATGHADSVTNSGTLLGAVLLREGDNLFDNSGTTAGAVTAGSGADTLTNTGVVTGAVDLGGGANTVTNHGRLEAGLTLGAGDDTLLERRHHLGRRAARRRQQHRHPRRRALRQPCRAARMRTASTSSASVDGDITLGNGADSLVYRRPHRRRYRHGSGHRCRPGSVQTRRRPPARRRRVGRGHALCPDRRRGCLQLRDHLSEGRRRARASSPTRSPTRSTATGPATRSTAATATTSSLGRTRRRHPDRRSRGRHHQRRPRRGRPDRRRGRRHPEQAGAAGTPSPTRPAPTARERERDRILDFERGRDIARSVGARRGHGRLARHGRVHRDGRGRGALQGPQG